MSVIAFPLGDGCPGGGRLVDVEATYDGLLWCPSCQRPVLTERASTDGSARQVEHHHRRISDAVQVRTVGSESHPLPISVRVPRDGQLTRLEARELSAQLLGVLAAGHPLDHDYAHPVDAMESW